MFTYLGMGTVVERIRPQTGTRLSLIATGSYTGDAGDRYVRFDRFGRLTEHDRGRLS